MQNNMQKADATRKPSERVVFERIAKTIRENYVATYKKESENSLLMRFVDGRYFRLTLEEVCT